MLSIWMMTGNRSERSLLIWGCVFFLFAGMFGSMVVLLLLIIICLIVITEKSFISGVMKMQKSGSRMVHAAKQDYDLYREHSADRQRRKPDEELSEEDYLARRR